MELRWWEEFLGEREHLLVTQGTSFGRSGWRFTRELTTQFRVSRKGESKDASRVVRAHGLSAVCRAIEL